MNSTSVHPQHVPKLCCCGHDLRAHNGVPSAGVAGIYPNTCRECQTNTPGQAQQHNFQSPNDLGFGLGLGPSAGFGPYFQARDLARTVNAGGGAFAFIMRCLTNSGGQPIVLFPTPLDPRLKVGMTMVVFPTQFQNQASYIVTAINFLTGAVTVDRNLQGNTNNFNCLFTGTLGSTMGPGRPANGQRAG